DWHLNHEIGVLRDLQQGTRVRVGKTGKWFKATSLAKDTDDAELVHFSHAYRVINAKAQSFVKAKSHRRAKAARHRRKLALRSGALRAFEDVVIPPSSTCNVTIAGDLRGKKEWYVERNLVPVKGDVFLTVPNTIITTDPKPVLDAHGEPTIAVRSVLPVTNPTARPYVLRAGTLLAFAKDPKEYLDTPSSQEQLDEYNASAQVLATLVRSLSTQDAAAEPPGEPTVRATAPGADASAPLLSARKEYPTPAAAAAETELDPPATAEAPDPTVYPSAEMEKILDLSPDLPADVREKALEMLKKHVMAFGFDGRL
ncbi:hypothetical protein EXIGLDRAFT_782168, partial [Exidia glandulosa HHB12029]